MKGLTYLPEVFKTYFMGHEERVTIKISKHKKDLIKLHLKS